ncbi:glycerophosphodiester phosphodiesterase [Xaviernesmea oryzae]|uniref:Glycerophosphodiester phosphodiesterase n=1 Tax=Xaviernesmea oryzae TaxID=464029 RepID=A0A1Q9ATV8_9HYPH|nr:glycerophosphodiester phosphodiesterase family protein [Xaviernesmea oryzae]OLP58870.1 glycerophosphodiester phosphodiesterase [Xaviernesmea oryzae]SEM03353.1 Glycerophosphoryl diester phosphodiesterase [Xaviernesmea oryzae]
MREGSRGISIRRDGHETWFKWHRGRRQAGDLSFTRHRLIEGLRLGASLEIDLVRYADPGFAVLHDETLDAATTGQGPVLAASAETLRGLRLRLENGQPTDHPVMLIEDLGRLIAETRAEAGETAAVVQLDMKEASTSIREDDIAAFARAIQPVARSVILSAGDAEAVARLSAAVPDMPIGYDPCHFGASDALRESRDFKGFVAQAVEASPHATMIYLEYPLVLFAAEAGFDIIAAFHQADRRVDAYTLTVTSPEAVADAERLLALKVDQITTDDPAGLEQALARAG